jgi:hypothetical protein
VEVWSHGSKNYDVVSYYSLPDDAWNYELTGLSDIRLWIAIQIPDATPYDGPFTPRPAREALVMVTDGEIPWPILRRFMDLVESSGDLTMKSEAVAVSGDLSYSTNDWHFEGRRFEVNSFHLGMRDSWCYEFCDVEGPGNNYLEVRIPDRNPLGGPFMPEPVDQVGMTVHGKWTVPWLIFQHFVRTIEASGDIVEDLT